MPFKGLVREPFAMIGIKDIFNPNTGNYLLRQQIAGWNIYLLNYNVTRLYRSVFFLPLSEGCQYCVRENFIIEKVISCNLIEALIYCYLLNFLF